VQVVLGRESIFAGLIAKLDKMGYLNARFLFHLRILPSRQGLLMDSDLLLTVPRLFAEEWVETVS